MKVLHLPLRASQMSLICKGLREIGIDATACNFITHPFGFNDKEDICLHLEKIKDPKIKQQKIREFFEKAVKEYDIFHFHHCGFFPSLSDLEYVKRMGRKMVIQHTGSEVRRLSIARGFNNPYVQVKPPYHDESIITSKLESYSKIFAHALVADFELYPYVKEYYKNIHIIPQVINLKAYTPSYSSFKEKPLVVHAPSNRKVKGTEYILEAVQRLKEKGYQFEFKLIENMKNNMALQLYRHADIIIDQICIGAYGIVSLEGMAFGKPVICYIRKDLLGKYPSSLPIVNGNPTTIHEVLKDLLEKPEKRTELGIKGRKYVEQNHDHLLIAKKLENIYKRL